MGHSRTSAQAQAMSALPPRTDIGAAAGYVRQRRAHLGMLFARPQLLLGVGESRFEHVANRLPRAAVELN
jgi:hypothetical protein